jgi:lysophospholipase L1-like esterase
MHPPRRRTKRRITLLIAALAMCLLAAASTAQASPQKVGPPTRITALGDSITRGFNSQGSGCIAFADCPANSWATGTNAGVISYLARVKLLNPSAVQSNPVRGNDAVTGAKMAGLAGPTGQAQTAVAGNPDLVLIEIGANDVCTSNEASMTTVASFSANFTDAMNRLSTGLPDARIAVSSIPNIFNLWNVLKGNATARLVWGLGSICQSMLANPASTSAADNTRRANVQARNVALNGALQSICAQYIHCHYDGGAAYAINFLASDVGTNDFFHPNTNGQAKAAAAAFTNGPSYTDLTAPTTTINRDRPADGSSDWYRNNVTVSLTAADGNDAVAGSEFFYKLDGAADLPWTKYTGPFTVSTEGLTDVVARSVDSNGNIEASKTDVIKVDKHAPSFTLTCAPGPYVLGSSQTATISGAADSGSGFAADPNGDFPIDTSQPGNNQPNDVEIADRAGNTTQQSCSYDVHYPDPGAPVLTSGTSPNGSGAFTLAWTGTDPSLFGIRYSLEHQDADDGAYSPVANDPASRSHAFTAGSPEGEGTWTYRVKGSDTGLGLETAYSPASDPVKVDKSAPAAPTLTADRLPDYAGGGGWFKDTVTVSSADNGDPALQDGSAGTGVDPSTVAAPRTVTAAGPTTLDDKVDDNVGNTSAAGTLGVQVDPDNPLLSISCPTAVLLNAPGVTATVSASDPLSGLASDPSGSVPISTATVGVKTVTRTATDNVAHGTTRSCATSVGYMFGGVQQPVNPDGSSIFKLGSAVPLKFGLTDFAGQPISGAVAKLTVAKLTGTVEGTFMEAEAKGSSSTGNVFSQDGAGQYHYNLDSKTLSTGTWSAKITLDDGNSYTTRISLR